jgi:hypothetical protein
MSTGKLREASSKLRRISDPVKPRPSIRVPGSSFRFAKATRKGRGSALATRVDEIIAKLANKK